MKYCFILANSRLGYFNIERVAADVGEKTRFVLIVEKKFLGQIPDSLQQHLFHVLPIETIEFELIKDNLKSLKISPKELTSSCIACTDEKSLITAAQLREYFGMHGAKPYQYVPFSSKRLMKEILLLNNIKVPKFLDFDGEYTKNYLSEYHYYLSHLFNGAYVVKPLDGGGSLDTAIIKNSSDLKKWYDSCYSKQDKYTAEEFVDGTFYHCDSFIVNGKIKFATVFEYLCPNIDFTFGQTLGGFPLSPTSPLREKALQFNKDIIDALQVPNGATHLEFFLKNEDLIFIEIGARPGGKTVVLCHEKNSGINLYEYTLREALQLPLNFNLREKPFHSWISFPKVPGIVKQLNPPILNSTFEIYWQINEGERIDNLPSSLREGVAADLMLFNHNYDKLIDDINILRNHKIYL
jgi:hypothetical protein